MPPRNNHAHAALKRRVIILVYSYGAQPACMHPSATASDPSSHPPGLRCRRGRLCDYLSVSRLQACNARRQSVSRLQACIARRQSATRFPGRQISLKALVTSLAFYRSQRQHSAANSAVGSQPPNLRASVCCYPATRQPFHRSYNAHNSPTRQASYRPLINYRTVQRRSPASRDVPAHGTAPALRQATLVAVALPPPQSPLRLHRDFACLLL